MSAADYIYYIPLILVLAMLWLPIPLERIPAKYLGIGSFIVALSMWHFGIRDWAFYLYLIMGIAFTTYAFLKYLKKRRDQAIGESE